MPPAAGTLQQPLLNGSDNDKTPPPHLAIGVVQPPAVAAVTAEGVVPIVLETRGLNYFLGGDKAGQEKQILKGVNLRFSSGVLTAVMGYVGVCMCEWCVYVCQWLLLPLIASCAHVDRRPARSQ